MRESLQEGKRAGGQEVKNGQEGRQARRPNNYRVGGQKKRGVRGLAYENSRRG